MTAWTARPLRTYSGVRPRWLSAGTFIAPTPQARWGISCVSIDCPPPRACSEIRPKAAASLISDTHHIISQHCFLVFGFFQENLQNVSRMGAMKSRRRSESSRHGMNALCSTSRPLLGVSAMRFVPNISRRWRRYSARRRSDPLDRLHSRRRHYRHRRLQRQCRRHAPVCRARLGIGSGKGNRS